MTTISIDPKSIRANGFSSQASAISHHLPFIENTISVFRMRHSFDDLTVTWPTDESYYEGSRFSTNLDVARRLLSAVFGAVSSELRKTGQISGYNEETLVIETLECDAFINSASAADLDILIADAMRDCASADHWYTFEKQW